MNFLDWLPSDFWGRLLLSLVPLIVGAALRWAFRSNKKALVLRSSISTMTAIDDLSANPLLSVRYNEQPISDLKVTTTVLWNDGQEEIRRQNLVPEAPPTIEFPNGTTILEATILQQSRPSTSGQLGIQGNLLLVDFEYLNPNDAIIIHCLHTGPLEEVSLKGDLIGKSTDIDYNWSHHLGIHGRNDEGLQNVVNLKRLGAVSAAINLVFVTGLLAGFLFQAWWPVISVAAILFVASIIALWPTHPIPKAVRRGLEISSSI